MPPIVGISLLLEALGVFDDAQYRRTRGGAMCRRIQTDFRIFRSSEPSVFPHIENFCSRKIRHFKYFTSQMVKLKSLSILFSLPRQSSLITLNSHDRSFPCLSLLL
jgi:hypothetical protein